MTNEAHFGFRLSFARNDLVPLAFLVPYADRQQMSRTENLGALFSLLT
jgi:hypothetical protein